MISETGDEAFVIIGANGYLGSNIIAVLNNIGYTNIIATSRNTLDRIAQSNVQWLECDVTQDMQVSKLVQAMHKFKSCRVAYLASYHHPDLVQKNPKLAWDINIVALAKFLNSTENVQNLYYPSSDTVYGEGSKEYHFKESDPLKPVNLYGSHKVLAEHIVTTYGYNVVRYPFLIGPSLLVNKKHFYDNICDTLLSGGKIEMFMDSYRSVLDFQQAASFIVQLMLKNDYEIPKIINIAGDEVLSKYDIGIRIANKLNVDTSLVIPISADSGSHIFQAPRAKSAIMDNNILKKVLQLKKISLSL